jgi:hypothetical protein
MIVANLFFVKNTNGLFYYSIDYLENQKDIVRKILVRPEMQLAAERLFPEFSIQTCSNFFSLLLHAFIAARKGDLIYTPTPHPLPVINHQWIVIHDRYPFLSGIGRLKLLLLRMSLATSHCKIAYINESETREFVQTLNFPQQRLIFAPNIVNDKVAEFPRYGYSGGSLRVGLVGTDSAKKCYSELLESVTSAGLLSDIEFVVFGHPSAYFITVCRHHPSARITLQNSDVHSLKDFLADVDLVVSVAKLEGFGRPIASALVEQVPCFLLRRPVFLEFFPTATFFETITSLVAALGDVLKNGIPKQPPYTPPLCLIAGARSARMQLRADGLKSTSPLKAANT